MKKTRREFLETVLHTSAAGLVAGSATACRWMNSDPRVSSPGDARAAGKPNVIVILADDLGYGDLRRYQALHPEAGPPDAKTPNIDSLAENGVLFTDFYAHPVCTPTRYCLLTGRQLMRSKDLRDLVVLDYDNPDQGLRPWETTIAETFRAQGYSTDALGKWHLGSGRMVQEGLPPRPPFSNDNPFHPNEHGFQYFYGFLGGSEDYCTHTKIGTFFDWFENKELLFVDDGRGNNLHPDHGRYMSHLVTERAVQRIHHHAERGEPFFMYVAHPAPHWANVRPLTLVDCHQLPQEEDDPGSPHYRRYLRQFDDVYPGGDETNPRKRLLAMVKALDDGVGDILGALRQRGLEENTIIVFVSDNGGEQEFGAWMDTSIRYGSSNGRFTRGKKGSLYEGGIRVPAIVQWKGRIAPNTVSTQLGSVIDWKPTLEALCGVTADARDIDGLDLSAVLLSAGNQKIGRDIFYQSGPYGAMFRREDYKYIRRNENGTPAQPELYNVAKDPAEVHDLAASRPEIVRELETLHARTLASLD